MNTRISDVELKKLFDELSGLFPHDDFYTTPGLSGNSRVFKEGDFRIGRWCTLRNEKDPALMDVGFWNNYHNCVEVTEYGLNFSQLRSWYLNKAKDAVKFADEQKKKKQDQNSKVIKTLVVAVACLALLVIIAK